jgi:hypothetical protein
MFTESPPTQADLYAQPNVDKAMTAPAQRHEH